MRKRSKYRPKGVVYNTIAYVMESMSPVEKHGSYLLDLKIKNHAAITALTQGRATRADIDAIITMVNVVEALYRMGFGKEYEEVVLEGLASVRAVARRGVESGRFILKAHEMTAINTVTELHDAQMEVITVKDMEKAIQIIENEWRQKKMTPILERA